MRTHKYINDPKDLLEQGKRIVSEKADHKDRKFIYRVSMVNLMLSGLSPKELSSNCGYSERTLQGWLKKVDEFGWETLRTKKQTGRSGKLTDQQREEIKISIKEGPEKSGYTVWGGPSLSDHIKTRYGIDYGVRACQILMHTMEFSLIRPQIYPSLENPDIEARENFKKTDRNQPKLQIDFRISRRSSFSSADNHHKNLGRKGFRT